MSSKNNLVALVALSLVLAGSTFSACAAKSQADSAKSSTPAAKHSPVSAKSPKKSASEIAEDKAIALVEKTKEVRIWEKAFGPSGVSSSTGGKPGFDIESHHGSVYSVHVFEDKPDQALTFARYEVNIQTGRVKKVD